MKIKLFTFGLTIFVTLVRGGEAQDVPRISLEMSLMKPGLKLVTAYYTDVPAPAMPEQRVVFGTSGHRGSAFEKAFNEDLCFRGQDRLPRILDEAQTIVNDALAAVKPPGKRLEERA